MKMQKLWPWLSIAVGLLWGAISLASGLVFAAAATVVVLDHACAVYPWAQDMTYCQVEFEKKRVKQCRRW